MNFWPPNHLLHQGKGRSGIQGDPGLDALGMDLLQAAVQVFRCFGMNHDLVRPGLGEILDIRFGMFHHEMAVKEQFRHLADFRDDRRAEGQVRHEIAIHDVDVYPVGPAGFDFTDFIPQAGKVCR